MDITGRLTADAEVRTTKNSKQVVTFTVAVNDYYKPKDGEPKEFEEFFNCSFWQSTKIADSLLKGSIVTATGRIWLNQYKGKDGNNHASLAVHVNAIKILAKGGKKAATQSTGEAVFAGTSKDDLPF